MILHSIQRLINYIFLWAEREHGVESSRIRESGESGGSECSTCIREYGSNTVMNEKYMKFTSASTMHFRTYK